MREYKQDFSTCAKYLDLLSRLSTSEENVKILIVQFSGIKVLLDLLQLFIADLRCPTTVVDEESRDQAIRTILEVLSNAALQGPE